MTQTHEQLHDLIVEQLALTGVPASECAAIVTRVVDVLAQRIFVDLLPLLSDEDRFVLADMLSDGELSDAEIAQFLHGAMGTYKEHVQASINAFFREMRETVTQYGAGVAEDQSTKQS